MRTRRFASMIAVVVLAACTTGASRADSTSPVAAVQPTVEAPASLPPADDLLATGAPTEDAAIAAWASILETYRTTDGGFRYAALASNPADLDRLRTFVAFVGTADTMGWERDHELAFLINAYNALTIASVVELWPVGSVLAVPGFFDARTHRVAGADMTLNHLENERIRARFAEPRIHFVVNCASAGCPWLPPRPVTADNLEAVLDAQTRSFLDRTVRIDDGTAYVSQIFEWFADDFEPAGGVRAFLAAHLDDERAAFVSDHAHTVAFTPYDWAVNARD